MKKITLLFSLFCLPFFYSCTSNKEKESKPLSKEEVANQNIKSYLKTKLDDPKSYEEVGFDSLTAISKSDSLILSLRPIRERREVFMDLFKSNMRLLSVSSGSESKRLEKESKEREAYIISLENKMDSILNESKKPENKEIISGYYKAHTFRSKNKLGALELNKVEFVLDTTLNVTQARPIESSI